MADSEQYMKTAAHAMILGFAVTVVQAWASGPMRDGRTPPDKPASVSFDDRVHRDDVVIARFGENVGEGVIVDILSNLNGPAAAGVTWRRSYGDPAPVRELVASAEARLGRDLPDISNTFTLDLPPGLHAKVVVDRLNARAEVEIAMPGLLPPPPPMPPDFTDLQGYIDDAPKGTGAETAWAWPGGKGHTVSVIDIEYAFNDDHMDLPPVEVVGPTPVDPFNDNNHGTAVLGEMVSIDNGFGTTGGVPDAAPMFTPANTGAGWDVASAVVIATQNTAPGDVILIEQQTWGPNEGAFVPVEWVEPIYQAIVVAVANGRHVVEAAGNGGQDLDSPIFSQGNGGHYPFLAENDSGAIIVGAGSPATGHDDGLAPLAFSNYGSRVNVQGWGAQVVTTGYGSLYSQEGVNLWYTAGFSGTSSASPIVANAVIALESIHHTIAGAPMDPLDARDVLVAYATPQQGDLNKHIGPRPDVVATLAQVFPGDDCDADTVPDWIEIQFGLADDTDGDGVPDDCESCPADLNDDGELNVLDFVVFQQLWQAQDGAADCDANASFDILDFVCFQQQFNEGCR